jgi:DNA-binding response OmpR family regulator
MTMRTGQSPETDRKTSQTVLIIEDETDIGELIQIVLRDEGYQVRWCQTGRSGLMTATSLLPDVIVLDLMLPDLSGQEVLRQLKSNQLTRHIPVIIESAISSRLTRHERDLVTSVLAKPFEIDDLISVVQHAVGRQSHFSIADSIPLTPPVTV